MANQVIKGVGIAALSGVAANAPFAKVLNYAGKALMILSIPILAGGFGLYFEDIAGQKLYDEHTETKDALLLEKIVDEDYLNEGAADLKVLVDVAGEEIVITHKVRGSIFNDLVVGETVQVIIPNKELYDYYRYERTNPSELGIEVVDGDYEGYTKELIELQEKMAETLSPEQQEFKYKKYGGPQLKATVDAELNMGTMKGLLAWISFCVLTFIGGLICFMQAKRINKKYGNLSANEIGNAKRQK